jgi:hypothetical protein
MNIISRAVAEKTIKMKHTNRLIYVKTQFNTRLV